MTNRKCCGSCCFFEASATPGLGLCQNPEYQGRDSAVLLRAEELGCRTGWQKDFWQARNPADSEGLDAKATIVSVEQVTIAAVETDRGIAVAAEHDTATRKPAPKPAASAFPAGRRRPAQAAGTPPTVPVPAVPVAATSVSSLHGHPELGENGEVIRRPSRSVVAEAHRKALMRREGERETANTRRQEQHEAAIASMYSAQPVAPANATKETVARPVETVLPPAERTTLPATGDAFAVQPVRQPLERPLPTEKPVRVAIGEDLDRPVVVERTLAAVGASARQMAHEERPVQPAQIPNADTSRDEAVSHSPRRAPLPTSTTQADPAGNSADLRYWDQPRNGGGFVPMRQVASADSGDRGSMRPDEPVQAATSHRDLPPIERTPVEPIAPVDPPVGRTIRPRQPLSATMGNVTERVPVPQPQRIPRPAVATEPRATQASELQATEPALPTVPVLPPRQVDAELVRQLQDGWREQALAANPRQRCGTCRYFKALDTADRGSCSCAFVAGNRQNLGRTDLGCLDALGSWWAPTDDGWIQKTEVGRRQSTPLVDQLLAEMGGAEFVIASAERRRGVR